MLKVSLGVCHLLIPLQFFKNVFTFILLAKKRGKEKLQRKIQPMPATTRAGSG